jgi:Putative transposase of IS4/5 family (DUF4096)
MADFFWFSDEQWSRIEPLLPTGLRGARRVDDRRVLSGIVHALQSGGRWGDCPPVYGPKKMLYNRFVRWPGPKAFPTGCLSTAPASRSTAPQEAQKGGLGQWYRPDTRRPKLQGPRHLRREGASLRADDNSRKCPRYEGRQGLHRGHAAVRRAGRRQGL